MVRLRAMKVMRLTRASLSLSGVKKANTLSRDEGEGESVPDPGADVEGDMGGMFSSSIHQTMAGA